MARTPRLGLPLQTLRNAPDALEGRKLRGGTLEIDPGQIETEGRLADRLQLEVQGLKASIQANGQRVPILVRPVGEDRYALIYGRRRLEACRELGIKVRAIVTEIDAPQALRDQLIENQERRDLSFIERAQVALALLEGDHLAAPERTGKGVAEVLNLTEAGVSQLLNVVWSVGPDLIQAIGSAPGIGRPRWEELKKRLSEAAVPREELVSLARNARAETGGGSDRAFLAVLAAAKQPAAPAPKEAEPTDLAAPIAGVGVIRVQKSARGKQLKLHLTARDKQFVDWLEGQAPQLIAELHGRWQRSQG